MCNAWVRVWWDPNSIDVYTHWYTRTGAWNTFRRKTANFMSLNKHCKSWLICFVINRYKGFCHCNRIMGCNFCSITLLDIPLLSVMVTFASFGIKRMPSLSSSSRGPNLRQTWNDSSISTSLSSVIKIETLCSLSNWLLKTSSWESGV